MNVSIGGQSVRLTGRDVIGKGGEADIYDLRNGTVAKLYKLPADPDYTGNPRAQAGAKLRLEEQQRKLVAFPAKLPSEVVAPLELVYGPGGSAKVAGYTMPYLKGMEVLLRYGDRRYREHGGIDGDQIVDIFRNLHTLVQGVHQKRVVIGDFNDLNVLVDPSGRVFLVDADSMQFGGFLGRTFTARFLDPLNAAADALELVRPHNQGSDWYAFTTMVFQSLLFTGPYGGVHRPKSGKRLQHDARVLKRLTVFDGDVIYPKPALRYDVLPDELLEYFQRVYERDERNPFPFKLLDGLRWTTCSTCGTVHARARCPRCAAPGIVVAATETRGNVTATRVFQTHGRLVCVAFQHGALRYLYHEDGSFKRENGAVVVQGKLDPELRFRVSRNTTLLGKRNRLMVFGAEAERLETDTYGKLSLFDANGHGHYWTCGGQLRRQGPVGSEYIGDVLPGRTLFWTGERFGFGFYQAGQLMRAFVFDARKPGLNDQVAIPAFAGQLIDTTSVFSDSLVWFMATLQVGGRLENHCYVVNARGEVVATATAGQDEDSWLSGGIRGGFAAGSSLYVPTDEGVVRIAVDGGQVRVAQTFPDTEPFVDSTSQLLPGNGGIHVISGNRITLLSIK